MGGRVGVRGWCQGVKVESLTYTRSSENHGRQPPTGSLHSPAKATSLSWTVPMSAHDMPRLLSPDEAAMTSYLVVVGGVDESWRRRRQ